MANNTIIYNGFAVKIDKSSDTSYAIYFNYEACGALATNKEDNPLISLCEKAVLESHRALSFDYCNIDCGVITMRHNPLIESSEFSFNAFCAKVDQLVKENLTY